MKLFVYTVLYVGGCGTDVITRSDMILFESKQPSEDL